MRRLQITSIIILIVGIICLLVWRFTALIPDWVVRGTGVLLLISIFLFVFSSIRLKNKNT